MPNLECESCKYKFKSLKMVERCPYCSKEGSVSSGKTAQDLLDETFGEAKIMDEERERRKS